MDLGKKETVQDVARVIAEEEDTKTEEVSDEAVASEEPTPSNESTEPAEE